MDLSKFEEIDSVIINLDKRNKEALEILDRLKSLPEGKKLKFNYKDTEDFKHPIGDFSGFLDSIRWLSKGRLPEGKGIASESIRETGDYIIWLTNKKVKDKV